MNYIENIIAEIKTEFEKNIKRVGAGLKPATKAHGVEYFGTKSQLLGISVPVRRKIIGVIYQKYKHEIERDFIRICDILSNEKFHEYKTAVGYLISRNHNFRKDFDFKHLNSWLEQMHGWCEVDNMGIFSADDLLANLPKWKKFITELSKDKNINKRRAALVLLVAPVNQKRNEDLYEISIEIIDRLKHEKDILITKAVSWLLRAAVKFHKDEVDEYMKKNSNLLPKIAVRETGRKIETGKKK